MKDENAQRSHYLFAYSASAGGASSLYWVNYYGPYERTITAIVRTDSTSLSAVEGTRTLKLTETQAGGYIDCISFNTDSNYLPAFSS